ncbi:hypothetical protein [Aliidiomarina haloalkalitolerans]|uniref:Secreted protein n=1 Tax=Aliidiomarina haloalkalitolerans TaxID=859059 RepID=A0A432VUR4_9GAMM|nr:hypothetical protein [Aliidiomarina haloalkalitolerans]RUO20270.1 hypothetical protein CWE06_06495 [Aliidiomarina haloalkalitolerans]
MLLKFTVWSAGLISLITSANVIADTSPTRVTPSAPHTEFFQELASLCGKAFAGTRVVERPGRDLLVGNEQLRVHFRECTDNQVFAPFHIERPEHGDWDRSRTWIYTHYDDHLTLSHDHREADGKESDDTGYGGATVTPGSANQQLFIFTERTGEQGEVLGWRIELEPGKRYSYGTMADGDWTWRVDFDLSQEVDIPPAPWGYDELE